MQIPAAPIRDGKRIDIVCEAQPGGNSFRHLGVPASCFLDHLESLAIVGEDKINLFLAATPPLLFIDQRGPGRISFAKFEHL